MLFAIIDKNFLFVNYNVFLSFNTNNTFFPINKGILLFLIINIIFSDVWFKVNPKYKFNNIVIFAYPTTIATVKKR